MNKKYNLKFYRKNNNSLVFEFNSNDIRYLHRKYRSIMYSNGNPNINYYDLYCESNFFDDKNVFNTLKFIYTYDELVPFFEYFLYYLDL